MTVTNRYVAPIVVAEQPGGLMQTARPLPTADWKGGITFLSTCTSIGRWGCVTIDPYVNPTGDLKYMDARTEPVRFDPFMLYSGIACSGAPDEQELRGIARAGLTRGRSGEIAHELVTSLVGNPDLSSYATFITPATPVGLVPSISGLLSAIPDMGGGEVMLHVNLAALPYLLSSRIISWRVDGYFLGHIPVSVDDYPFTTSDTAAGAANPDLTPLYMTRPVEIAHTVASDDYDLTTRLNEGQALSEDFAVLRFDTCASYSIVADLSKS